MSITTPIGDTYGQKVLAVEPGGAEAIPVSGRHGRPSHLAWTWASPNLEFATIFVGALAVLYYGLSLPAAIAAILLGTTVASVLHAVLTTWGPQSGLAQMVINRRAFGFWGNVVPGGLNAVLSGVGWFAVNSISGAFALTALTGLATLPSVVLSSLISLALAFFGHNLIQVFERFAFPLLAVIFAIGVIVIVPHANIHAPADPIPGAFWIAVSTSFGYTIAWAPLAADYSRYLRPDQARAAGLFAGLGVWVSNNVLQVAGAIAVSAIGLTAWNYDNPTASYTALLPEWLGALTLLAIWIGALCANTVNLYSSGLSFLAIGVTLSSRFARATVVVVAGIVGALIAIIGASNVEFYENFLLLMGYWIGPWIGVMLADHILFRRLDPTLYTHRRFVNLAGPLSMVVAMIVSITLFSNQTLYVGPAPQAVPALGDVTFVIGFILAFGLYAALRRLLPPPGTPSESELSSATQAPEVAR